jgi:adenosine deaminase
MPKVELHVHLEGSIQPETLLELARRNRVALPADTVEGLRAWYRFRDFAHFVEVYVAISNCLCQPEDFELITRRFLERQAAQNIRWSEVTFTPYMHHKWRGLAWEYLLAAINRARAWGEAELGVAMGLVIDIPRGRDLTVAEQTADWAIDGIGRGVIAFGLGGSEQGHPPEWFAAPFARARAAGLPSVPHAGETVGPESIWGALRALEAVRIGHGVRCIEDPELVAELRARQVPLEVCPVSNVCLGVYASLREHPLPQLLAEGLYVTLNSDDPPMFNTSLTGEYLAAAKTFGLDAGALRGLVMNALRASFLPQAEQARLEADFSAQFARLERELL